MKAVLLKTGQSLRPGGLVFDKPALEKLAEQINAGQARPTGWTKCKARLEHAGDGEYRLIIEGEGPRR